MPTRALKPAVVLAALVGAVAIPAVDEDYNLGVAGEGARAHGDVQQQSTPIHVVLDQFNTLLGDSSNLEDYLNTRIGNVLKRCWSPVDSCPSFQHIGWHGAGTGQNNKLPPVGQPHDKTAACKTDLAKMGVPRLADGATCTADETQLANTFVTYVLYTGNAQALNWPIPYPTMLSGGVKETLLARMGSVANGYIVDYVLAQLSGRCTWPADAHVAIARVCAVSRPSLARRKQARQPIAWSAARSLSSLARVAGRCFSSTSPATISSTSSR